MTMEEAIRLDNNRRLCKHRSQAARLFLRQTEENLNAGDLTRSSYIADKAVKEIQSLLALLENVKTVVKAEKREREE